MARSRRAAASRNTYVADFETTVDPDDCRVWLWGLTDLTASFFDWDIDIDSFFDRISGESAIVYFHNLEFDGHFIIDRIMRAGFEWRDNDEFLYKGSFTTLIDSDGKFYMIDVKWHTGFRTLFYDSLKKVPMSLAKMAKAYHMPMSKGEIDYAMKREIGYNPTKDELEYLKTDLAIPARALKEHFDAGMKRMTAGSDSFVELKRTMGRTYDICFPVLSRTMDAEIRKAYRGGWTYVNPFWAKRITPNGMVFDVNSLYPSVMRNKPMPIGEPRFYESGPAKNSSKLQIFSVTFTARIRSGFLPCIQVRNSPFYLNTEYVSGIETPVTMVCTDIDWALWNEHYEIEVIQWNGTYVFSKAEGLFNDYIDHWMTVKANSVGGMREIAKLHLNSPYGKFATNPDVTGKYPVMEDGIVRLKKGREEFRDPIYTAVGVYVTAYGRDVTVRAAQKCMPNFAYADTDSVHLITDIDPDLDIHPTRIGAWKKELVFDAAFYARPKAYIEREIVGGEPKYHVKMAGLPEKFSSKLTFDDFVDGRRFEGKLRPRHVPGGIVLEDVGYTLNFG